MDGWMNGWILVGALGVDWKDDIRIEIENNTPRELMIMT
jgi:hypothetical protein